MNNFQLSDSEVRLITLIRALQPYDKIEIKLQDNHIGKIKWTITHLEQEVYQLDTSLYD